MLKGIKHKKSIAIKLLSVFLASAILAGAFSTYRNNDFLLTALAKDLPRYDSTLGAYFFEDGVLTAKPYENAGFRGWYDQTGNEVSSDLEFAVPSGASSEDYIPVFYDFELVSNGDFEAYSNGTDMKGVEGFEGLCDNEISGLEDWTSLTVSNDRAHSGNNSLKLISYENTAYRELSGLDPNSQYTVSFYYNIDPSENSSEHYLKFVSVIDENTDLTVRGNINTNTLASRSYDSQEGACTKGEWKKVSLTFYTDESTSARLCIHYKSSEGDRRPMYIDDLSLIKNEMESPAEYFIDSFELSHSENWLISNTARLQKSIDSSRLKLTPKLTYGSVQSKPLYIKSGCYYEISFDMDLSEVTDRYVPKVENGSVVTEEALITEENPNGYVWEINSSTGEYSPNWINFSLSNKKGTYGNSNPTDGSDSGLFVYDSNTENKNVDFLITNSTGSYEYAMQSASSVAGFGCFSIGTTLSGLSADDIRIVIRFTAEKTGKAYLNIRLNGLGTYYIDNVSVKEDASDIDSPDFITQSKNVNTLGTAIRVSERQGMRHKTEIDKRLLTCNNAFGVRLIEYGTLAIKSEYLNGSELVLDGEYTQSDGEAHSVKKGIAYSFDEGISKTYSEDQTHIEFTGVLINIDEKNWNSDYTVRAYFKYVDNAGNKGIFYSDSFDIAVYPISKQAYSKKDENGDFVEDDETREYLYDNIISKFTDKIIKISDKSEPLFSGFQGISSTVYHGVTFFPDSHGRTYTEAQAAVEMDRLADSKVNNVRTRFSSQWMWEEGGWNWESEKMTAFYRWANMLEERDISITLQAGWHLYDFIYYYNYYFDDNSMKLSSPHTSIPEVDYLHGEGTALYSEDSNATEIANALPYDLTEAEKIHYSVAAARYAEWIKQALNAFKAHGIYNVEYILPFTESGNVREDDETYSYDEWLIMTVALHTSLKNAGVRSDYKLIGPSQSLYAYQNRLSLLEYTYSMIDSTDYEDLLDINAMHQYTKPNTNAGYENTVFEPFASYSTADENFRYYNKLLGRIGERSTEFWCDEYFAHAPDAKWWNDVGMQMTQFAAGLTAGINNGVNRFISWQMFDTLWEGDYTSGAADGTSEMIGGVHAVGTCPSLIKADNNDCPNGDACGCNRYVYSSYIPRKNYYGINLLGKYLNNENADVLMSEVINDSARENGGVYVSAIENDNGQTVILVVNTLPTVSSVDIEVEKTNITSFSRYTYDPDEIVPTAEAKSISYDKKIVLNGANSFSDVIPSGSFVMYVASKAVYGADIDLSLGFDF